jgi:hypothetical protein
LPWPSAFAGDGVVRRYGGPAVLAAGAGTAALLLAAALATADPRTALIGFAAVGLGLANAVPILFGAAGRVPSTPPELAIAAVSTAGYCGFLLGPPVIGLAAERLGLAAGLGLVVIALAIIALGGASAALQTRGSAWTALSNGLK